MGFFDRLHDTVTGVLGAAEAPVGFVKDVLTSPLPDNNNRGMVSNLYHAFTDRGAQFLGDLGGPNQGLGAAIGGLPESVRGGFNEVIKPTQQLTDMAYTDLVGRPISTAVTAGSLASRGSEWGNWVGGQDALLNPSTWAEAWDISEHRSPGQSIALAFMTKDIKNPNQVKKAQGSDYYSAMSGTTDALTRFFLSPDVLAAGATTEYVKGLHALDTQQAINYAQRTGMVSKFVDHINGLAETTTAPTRFPLSAYFSGDSLNVAGHALIGDDPAKVAEAHDLMDQIIEHRLSGAIGTADVAEETPGAVLRNVEREAGAGLTPEGHAAVAEEARQQLVNKLRDWGGYPGMPETTALPDPGLAAKIRQTYFSKHPLGAPISYALAQAAGDPSEQERIVRIAMGATNEIDVLRASRADLAAQMDKVSQMRQAVSNMSLNGFQLNNAPDMLAEINAEHDALLPEEDRLNRLNQIQAGLQEIPKASWAQETRSAITRSDWYQSSPYATPLRYVFDMQPHHFAVLDDPSSDVQLWRMLQKSDLPLEEQQAIRSSYMGAMTPGERQMILINAENRAVSSIAGNSGMTTDEIQNVLGQAARRRGVTSDLLQSRKYMGGGMSQMEVLGEDGTMHKIVFNETPRFETQLSDLHPVADLDRVKKATTNIGQFRALHPSADLPAEFMHAFYNVWKPLELLRIGFPMRFIGDETLRSMAKLGAMQTALNMKSGAADAAQKVLERFGVDLKRDITGTASFDQNDYAVAGAFDSPGDVSVYAKRIKAREALDSLIQEPEVKILDELRRSGNWRSIMPDEPGYAGAYEHAANLQIGQSQIGRRFLDGQSVADVADWMNGTAQGRELVRSMGWGDNVPEHLAVSKQMVDDYLPTDELKQAALDKGVTHDMLQEAVPDAAQRPIVHGEILDQATGRSLIPKFYNRMVNKGFDWIASKPSDYLMRQPFFDHMYQAEVQRQIGLLTGEGPELTLSDRLVRKAFGGSDGNTPLRELTQEDLDRIQTNARNYALGQTKGLFHDFSEETRLADATRFFAPFMNAWQQILGRWAGLAVENPAFALRMRMLWRAPEKAGIVTDGAGNVVDENGKIVTPVMNSNYRKGQNAVDSQRNVTLSLPSYVNDIPGMNRIVANGKLKFGKDSLNLALHGWPTLGPLAAIPINEIAKDKPELADSLKWALPYGVHQNWTDIILPTTERNLRTLSQEEDNRSYAYTVLGIYRDEMLDYNLGKRKDPPTYADASDKAKTFWHTRTLASYVLPMTPQYSSPYQPWIDSFRARLQYDGTLTPQQKEDPSYKTPEEWFLDTYGDEYFPLVASMSKSMDHVPPTIEGYKMRQEYKDLIGKYPELGSLIVGQQGAGAFSRAVYESQFSTKINKGSPDTEREVQGINDYKTQASTSLGWIEYGRMADILDTLLKARGLQSFSQKGASDLMAIKQGLIGELATDPKYAGWYADYSNTDATKWDSRIQGMTEIVNSPGLTNRPEIQGLKEYLDGRKTMVAELKGIGKKNLYTNANAALSAGWDAYVQTLVEENPAFGALYHRWLANDPVVISPVTNLASTGTYTAAATG